MTLTRSITAVLGGLVLFHVIGQLLEAAAVTLVADGPVTDEASYFAARSQPAVLAARLGYTAAAALLAGYMTAKIAAAHELTHVLAAAGLVTAVLVWEFTGSAYAGYTPVWARLALLALVPPAFYAGGWVRAAAAAARLDGAGTPQPDRGTRP